MKRLFYILLSGIIFVSCARSDQNFFESKDAYFGLEPPGLIPEVFAPGIVSDSTWAEHCQVAISPKGDEIFWSAWTGKYRTEDGSKNTEQIFYSRFEKGSWAEPEIAEFIKNNRYGLNGGPVFSPAGDRIFFYQVKSPWTTSDMNTYYVEKIDGKWSDEPVDIRPPYNTADQDYSPIFTHDGFAYKNLFGKISRFNYDGDSFTLVDSFIIHKDFPPLWNFYLSPNGDYAIFATIHPDGFGDLDLYISFENEDGEWEYPINLGDKINTEQRERFPVVSPDGKYLFFMRHTPGQDFFWVSTEVFNEFKRK